MMVKSQCIITNLDSWQSGEQNLDNCSWKLQVKLQLVTCVKMWYRLVVEPPLWKKYESQLGWWISQLAGNIKIDVPNHQRVVGVPLVILHLNGISHYNPSILGTPMAIWKSQKWPRGWTSRLQTWFLTAGWLRSASPAMRGTGDRQQCATVRTYLSGLTLIMLKISLGCTPKGDFFEAILGVFLVAYIVQMFGLLLAVRLSASGYPLLTNLWEIQRSRSLGWSWNLQSTVLIWVPENRANP